MEFPRLFFLVCMLPAAAVIMIVRLLKRKFTAFENCIFLILLVTVVFSAAYLLFPIRTGKAQIYDWSFIPFHDDLLHFNTVSAHIKIFLYGFLMSVSIGICISALHPERGLLSRIFKITFAVIGILATYTLFTYIGLTQSSFDSGVYLFSILGIAVSQLLFYFFRSWIISLSARKEPVA